MHFAGVLFRVYDSNDRNSGFKNMSIVVKYVSFCITLKLCKKIKLAGEFFDETMNIFGQKILVVDT